MISVNLHGLLPDPPTLTRHTHTHTHVRGTHTLTHTILLALPKLFHSFVHWPKAMEKLGTKALLTL